MGSRDGCFVARAITRSKYSSEEELISFDPSGHVRWRIKRDYSGGDAALFSSTDVTVTTRGLVAVLDVIRNTVQLFSAKGEFIRVWKLQEIWGRVPSYPTDTAADTNGGVLIKDFQGKPPVVRMDANGKVISQLLRTYLAS